LDKKYPKMRWPEIVAEADKKNIELVQIMTKEHLENKGSYDLLVAKLTDELSNETPENLQIIESIKKFLQSHKDVKILDAVENQRGTLDRQIMNDLLLKVETEINNSSSLHKPFQSPKFLVLESSSDISKITTQKFQYPLIIKTLAACGSLESHDMAILFDAAQFHTQEFKDFFGKKSRKYRNSQLNKPNAAYEFASELLVQEYKNHDSIIFKVYCIGKDSVYTVKRPSLLNLYSTNLNGDVNKPIFLNSQTIPKEVIGKTPEDSTVVPPSGELLKLLTGALIHHLGMNLLGVDVIYCVDEKKYGIIDVNYFPGYGGVDTFPKDLVDLIEKTINKK